MNLTNPSQSNALRSLILCTAALLVVAAPVAAQGGDRMDETRPVLTEWAETMRIITKEKQRWATSRETLRDRIELMKRRIASVKEDIAETEKNISDSKSKESDLKKEHDDLQQTTEALSTKVAAIEARTLDFLSRCPGKVADDVRPFSQRIPKPGEEIKESLGARFRNVVGIVNAAARFNREVSLIPQVRDLGDGRSAEVTTLYLGLGQAWYASPDGKHAGLGTTSDKGWVWEVADDAAEVIAKAIAIYKNSEVAKFVPLPIKVK